MIETYKNRIYELTEEYQKLWLRAYHNPARYDYYILRLQEVGAMIENYKSLVRNAK